MDYYNCRVLRESNVQNDKSPLKNMDISTERFVEMNNKMNNLVEHKISKAQMANKRNDRNGKNERSNRAGNKNPEDDPNEFYDILWNGFIFLKKLGVLRNVYKNLKRQPEIDKKVDFLKGKKKDQLASFKKALLSGPLPRELQRKQKRSSKESKVNEEELLEEIDEEMAEEQIEDLQSGRTTLSKKHYLRIRERKIAKLKELYPLPYTKKPKEEEEEEEELANLEPDEQEDTISKELEEEMAEEEAESEKPQPEKLPKSKRRHRKKKKEMPAMSPCAQPLKPGYAFRKPLETEKRTSCSCDDRKTHLDPKRKKTRWSYDERHARNPSIAVKVEM